MNDYYYGDSQESSTPSQPPNQYANQYSTQYPSQPYPNTYDYSSYLPNGIPKSAIPYGKEDLYILKSEVVPPICPVCPPPVVIVGDGSNSSSSSSPPCPACERCPEPIVDCKKVIKYKQNTGSNYENASSNSNSSSGDSSGSGTSKDKNVYSGFNANSTLYKQGKYTPSSESTPVPLLNSFSAFGI